MAYEEEKQTAYDEIKAAGGAVTLQVPGATTTPDATKPWRQEDGTPTGYSSYAVFDDYKAYHIDGTNVRQGDRKAYVPALNLAATPERGMKLLANGGVEEWNVEYVEPTDPTGSDPILYTLQLRR